MHTPGGNSVTGFVLFLVLQIVFVIVFAVLGRYGKGLLPSTGVHDGSPEGETSLSKYPREFPLDLLIFFLPKCLYHHHVFPSRDHLRTVRKCCTTCDKI